MRTHYRSPRLVWLFVWAYGAHILEEWFGGFPEWFSALLGRPLPRPAFILINALALASMALAARAATRLERRGWMAIAIATIVLVNASAHIIGTAITGTYSPGLFTGVGLYLPLGIFALLRAREQASREMRLRGLLAGLALHALVGLIAFTASRAG